MAKFFINLLACLIGIEACSRAHHWPRKPQSFCHTLKLMVPQFGKPYVKTNKNDPGDAGEYALRADQERRTAGCFVAASGPSKLCKGTTVQANQIRGLLSELGLAVPLGIGHIASHVPEFIEEVSNELPGSFRNLFQRLFDHLNVLERQVDGLEA